MPAQIARVRKFMGELYREVLGILGKVAYWAQMGVGNGVED